jgi:zinc protease
MTMGRIGLIILTLALSLASEVGVHAQSAIPLPPIQYTDRILANGMRILLVEDHSAPTVAINVGYHVGGKDDPLSRSGFAHLFEHLMFKGTANTKPESFDRLTEDVGGSNNAFTTEDLTNYYEIVPSNYLETLLWAEADRLKTLKVDEPNFLSEREVVIGEYEQNFVANPYGKLELLIDGEAYTKHPYKRGVIGVPAQLRTASLEDVRKFHDTYYQPQNATLVVVGDLDLAQTNRWIDKYFGGIPKAKAPIPRVSIVEPKQSKEKRITYYGENVPLPAVALVYHAVSVASPDAAALQVLENLLAEGESSRLFRTLVYEQQIASSVSANADLREQPGLFDVYAVLNKGKKPEAAEKLLQQEIVKFQTQRVSMAELEKARTQLTTSIVRGRESNNSRAVALVRATIEEGEPARVNTALSELQAVTAADIQRVASQYLVPSNRTVIYYLPKPTKDILKK